MPHAITVETSVGARASLGVTMPRVVASLAPLLWMIVAAPPAVATGAGRDGRDDVPDYAIMYFDYAGDNPELVQLRKGFAHLLIADLSGDGSYRVVERSRIEEILRELELNSTSAVDPGTAQRIGKLVGADRLVLGDYADVGGHLIVTAHVVDVQTGVQGCQAKEKGTAADFLELEERVASALRVSMPRGGMTGCAPLGSGRPAAQLAHVGTGPVATFSRALDAGDRGDADEKRVLLQQVMVDEPDFGVAEDELASLLK